MNFCPNCNTPAGENHTFCASCGASLIKETQQPKAPHCPNCGAEVGDNHSFCPFCGTEVAKPQPRLCPNCGAAAEGNHTFCPFCGTGLNAAPKRPAGGESITCPNCDSIVRPYNGLCPFCGTELLSPAYKTNPTPRPSAAEKNRHKLHCPSCKSNNLDNATESNVSAGMGITKGNYTGMVFSNEHKHYWICRDCGEKFRNIQSLEEEIKSESFVPNCCKVCFFFMLFAVLFFGSTAMAMQIEILRYCTVFALVGCAITLLLWAVFAKHVNKLKDELDYLKTECFN